MSQDDRLPSVLFICTGNICRSPFAAALFKHYLGQASITHVECDSAGIHAMVDAPADPSMVEIADRDGFSLHAHRGRQIDTQDYGRFAYLIGMDLGHHDFLRATVPADLKPSIAPLMSYADAGTLEVPDPYKKGRRVFERAAKLIEMGVSGLINEIRTQGRN